jgi:dipeptidyl aminopeptidase/acylaminoacyl peptidase
MRTSMRLLLALLCLGLPAAAQKAPFTAEVLWKLSRISEPQLSPDGTQVAFTVGQPDIEGNATRRHIWTVPISGGTPTQITRDGTQNTRARWTPDSKHLIFLSNRGGSTQIWRMNPDGTEPKQISNLSTEADGVTVSPDGKLLLFTSEVYPECADDACNKAKLEAETKSKVKARTYTTLLYRHWNTWSGKRRKHLMIMPVEGGAAKDLTPGLAYDVPTFSLGGPDDYAFAPDSKEIAYITNIEADQALSTNTDVFTVSPTGGEPKRILASLGSERSPQYSPDGKYLMFRSQARAGFESDQWRLASVERSSGKLTFLTEALDRHINSFAFSPDSTRIFFTAEDRGRSIIQMMPISGGGTRAVVTGAAHMDDVQFAPDGKTLIYSEMSGSKPVEIYRASSAGGAPVPLTRLNEPILNGHSLTALEEFWVDSTDRTRVHSFLVKPPNFQAGRKYPVLMLIHGGPQSAWGEVWSYRWNPQVFANAGFVVVLPNPRGSIGYGQKFTDEVSADWGGKAYDDLMAVADYLDKQPFVDPQRMAAAGGSYGGYMVNWLLGHTNRFKALVSHAGVFELRSMAAETEELWFVKWEFQGMPWANPELYAKWSPSSYVNEFKTPTLVTHGELDYRVPVGQGLQLFTALQLQGVPSKMLLYPDEGHWILKPQNSLLWYQSVLDWVGEWTARKPEATQ